VRASALALLLVVGCARQAAGPVGDPLSLRRELARLFLGHRAWDDAVAPLREVLARRPDDAEAHAMLGIVYRERGVLDAAEAELRHAIRLAPRAAEPHADLALVLQNTGRTDEALAEHRAAVTLAPAAAAFHNNLGWSLLAAGRTDDAIAELRQALRADPSSRRARNNLGFALARAGDDRGAAREFERAGGPAPALNNMGLVDESRGNTGRACERYREAASRDPELEVAARNAARACHAREPAAPAKDRP
jgi:Flp pilus assembly protein TadD